jgi:hypothetical protein
MKKHAMLSELKKITQCLLNYKLFKKLNEDKLTVTEAAKKHSK